MRVLAVAIDVSAMNEGEIATFMSDLSGTSLTVGECQLRDEDRQVAVNLSFIKPEEITLFMKKKHAEADSAAQLEFLKKHKWNKGDKVCGCGAELKEKEGIGLYCPVAHPIDE